MLPPDSISTDDVTAVTAVYRKRKKEMSLNLLCGIQFFFWGKLLLTEFFLLNKNEIHFLKIFQTPHSKKTVLYRIHLYGYNIQLEHLGYIHQ